MLTVKHRLDVPDDGGERCAQFVRHVGDEVTLRAFGLLCLRTVMQDHHRTAARQRRRVHLEDATWQQGFAAAF